MTDDIDARAEAIAREACRRVMGAPANPTPALIEAARLALTGWRPTDPLLLEAREIVAARNPQWAAAIRAGKWDDSSPVTLVLAGLRRGVEIGKGAG